MPFINGMIWKIRLTSTTRLSINIINELGEDVFIDRMLVEY